MLGSRKPFVVAGRRRQNVTRPLMPSAPPQQARRRVERDRLAAGLQGEARGRAPRPNTTIDVAVDTPVAPDRGSPIGGNGGGGLQASAIDGAAAHASAANKPARTHRHPTRIRMGRW